MTSVPLESKFVDYYKKKKAGGQLYAGSLRKPSNSQAAAQKSMIHSKHNSAISEQTILQQQEVYRNADKGSGLIRKNTPGEGKCGESSSKPMTAPNKHHHKSYSNAHACKASDILAQITAKYNAQGRQTLKTAGENKRKKARTNETTLHSKKDSISGFLTTSKGSVSKILNPNAGGLIGGTATQPLTKTKGEKGSAYIQKKNQSTQLLQKQLHKRTKTEIAFEADRDQLIAKKNAQMQLKKNKSELQSKKDSIANATANIYAMNNPPFGSDKETFNNLLRSLESALL